MRVLREDGDLPSYDREASSFGVYPAGHGEVSHNMADLVDQHWQTPVCLRRRAARSQPL